MSSDGSSRSSSSAEAAANPEPLDNRNRLTLRSGGKRGGGSELARANHDADDLAEDGDDETTLNDETEELGKPPRREDAKTPPPHISSPSIPSPLSVGTLGYVTPLGQHLAASFSRTPEKSLDDSDGDQDYGKYQSSRSSNARVSDQDDSDGRDARTTLARRLHDLASKVSQGDSFADQATVDLLSGRVDELDRVFVTGQITKRKQQPQKRPQPTSLQQVSKAGREDARETSSPWASPSSSWMRSRYSDLSSSMSSNNKAGGSFPEPEEDTNPIKKPAIDSFKIASEAQKLNAELETLVNNLTARQEESEHIHQLLVTRAERAAQRIIFLQSRVHDLEAELQESDSDLSHLRLGLKAVEVFCPRDTLSAEDVELAQCIANWKSDYADLKKRRASRRSAAHLDGSGGNEGPKDDAKGRTSALSSSFHHEAEQSHLDAPRTPPAATRTHVRPSTFGNERVGSHASSSIFSPSTDVGTAMDSSVGFQTPSPVRRRAEPSSRRPPSRRGVDIQDWSRNHHAAAHHQGQQDDTLTPRSTRSTAPTESDLQSAFGEDHAPDSLLSARHAAAEKSRLSSSATKALRRITYADSTGTPPPPRRRSGGPDAGYFSAHHHSRSHSRPHSPRLVDMNVLASPLTIKRTGSARTNVGSPLRHHYSQPFHHHHHQSAEGLG